MKPCVKISLNLRDKFKFKGGICGICIEFCKKNKSTMRVCTVLLGFGLSYADSLPFGMHAIRGVDEVACRFLPDLHISECVRWLAPFMRYDESFGYG